MNIPVISRKDFEEAAEILQIVNPSAAAYGFDALVDSMVRSAETLEDGYCSTLGYVLTHFVYKGEFNVDGSPRTGVYVSLNYWGVGEYLKGRRTQAQGERLVCTNALNSAKG